MNFALAFLILFSCHSAQAGEMFLSKQDLEKMSKSKKKGETWTNSGQISIENRGGGVFRLSCGPRANDEKVVIDDPELAKDAGCWVTFGADQIRGYLTQIEKAKTTQKKIAVGGTPALCDDRGCTITLP